MLLEELRQCQAIAQMKSFYLSPARTILRFNLIGSPTLVVIGREEEGCQRSLRKKTTAHEKWRQKPNRFLISCNPGRASSASSAPPTTIQSCDQYRILEQVLQASITALYS
uniref:Uncharacterized protein n=1 Tax=Ditylenchus dipsaci TaxID=166011 RepID=A0A915DV52_9BILA